MIFFSGETMLLHVKGRRMCQIRLVEPKPSSINSGDAYIALNGTEVIGQWDISIKIDSLIDSDFDFNDSHCELRTQILS